MGGIGISKHLAGIKNAVAFAALTIAVTIPAANGAIVRSNANALRCADAFYAHQPRQIANNAQHEEKCLRPSSGLFYPADAVGADRTDDATNEKAPSHWIGASAYFFRMINDPIALFNAILAATTFLLWRATQSLWRSADRQGVDTAIAARAAAKSADVTERGLIVVERPFLVPNLVGLTSHFPASLFETPVDKFPDLQFGFTNYGKTPAIVDHIVALLFPHPKEPPRPVEAFDGAGPRYRRYRLNKAAVAPLEETISIFEEFDFPASFDITKQILEKETIVWFYGYIAYDDVFGVHHKTFFCRQYDSGLRMFIRYGGKAYNYSETEEGR